MTSPKMLRTLRGRNQTKKSRSRQRGRKLLVEPLEDRRLLAAAVIATIPVGSAPVGVAVDTAVNRIYVTDAGSNAVSVIDGATNTVSATIPVSVGTRLEGVVVNPATHRVYVVLAGGSWWGGAPDSVAVIDGAPGSATENTVIANIPVPGRELDFAHSLAFNPTTNRIYIPSFDPGGSVVVIDAATNSVQSIIPVAANPVSAAVDPVTNTIYVGHGSFFGRRRLTRIDGITHAVTDGPDVGLATADIAADPTTGRFYLHKGDTSRGDPIEIVAVDGASNSIVPPRIPGELSQFGGVGVNPTTNRVYVGDSNANDVSVIDGTPGSPTENQVIATVPVGTGPFELAVNPLTSRIYVADSVSNTVTVIEDVVEGVPVNQAPTASAGGPYTVTYGDALTLDGSGSTDPDLPNDTLTYAWDLNADGSYEYSGVSPTVPWADLAGLPVDTPIPLQLRVTDAAGATSSASTTLTIRAIAGRKFNDLDGDGVRDAGEPGLAGWTIYLDENDNGQWDDGERFTITDTDGNYVFDDLPSGQYEVRERLQPGWGQTYPAGSGSHVVQVGAPDVTFTYTTDADFDQGTLVNVNHDTPNNHQLQLDTSIEPFPFINVAASGRGTMVRINTDTGEIVGEYRTAPEGRGLNPSRTTVDLFGNVWVGNRDEGGYLNEVPYGSVVKIGLVVGGTRGDKNPDGSFTPNPSGEYLQGPFDYSTVTDRDGDGLIRTSGGLGQILGWPDVTDGVGGTTGIVEDSLDEAILVYQRLPDAPNVRHVSVDASNDVWVGGYDFQQHSFHKLDGETGQILDSFDARPFEAGGYGGLIDANGVLWSASIGQNALLRYDTNTGTGMSIPVTESYGLGIDGNGYVWNALFSADMIAKINPSGTIVEGFPKPTGGASGDRGVAVTSDGHVWVANSFGSNVSRLNNDGDVLKVIDLMVNPASAYASGPTGVAVDSHGKVWVTNLDSNNVMRIDPAGGEDHLGAVDGHDPGGRGDDPHARHGPELRGRAGAGGRQRQLPVLAPAAGVGRLGADHDDGSHGRHRRLVALPVPHVLAGLHRRRRHGLERRGGLAPLSRDRLPERLAGALAGRNCGRGPVAGHGRGVGRPVPRVRDVASPCEPGHRRPLYDHQRQPQRDESHQSAAEPPELPGRVPGQRR